MKKLCSFVLALLMTLTTICAIAEFDWASLSDDEIIAEIARGNEELGSRGSNFAVDASENVLFDCEGVTITYKSIDLEESWYDSEDKDLLIKIVIENNGETKIAVMADDCYVNGWQTEKTFWEELEAGSKTKSQIRLEKVVESAEISSLDDVESIEVFFALVDPETYDRVVDATKVSIPLNK